MYFKEAQCTHMEAKVVQHRHAQLPQEEPSLDPNEQLLLKHIELAKHFWEDGRWVVTDHRFAECLQDLGLAPTAPSPCPNPTDFFSQSRQTYAGNDIITVQGVSLKRVKPCDLQPADEVTDSISYHLQESLGIAPVEDPTNPEESIFPTTTEGEMSWKINDYEIFLYRISEPDAEPIQRPLCRENSVKEISRALRDRHLQKTDKVAQRTIADTLQETGILNPRYEDARFLNPPEKIIEFNNIAPSSLPSGDDVRQKLVAEPSGKHIWIVEDDSQGFIIVHDKDELYIESSKPAIKSEAIALGLNKREENPKHFTAQLARLRTFLRMISQHSSFKLAFLAEDQPSPYDASEFANELAANPSTVYVKSTRTAGGELILRHRRASDGQLVLESDSHELGHLLSITLDSIKSNQRLPPAFANRTIWKFLARCSVTGMLQHALKFMEAPIVEEEIPVAKYRTKMGIEKCEFRAIFQGREDVELVASYAKASLKDVAANISIAGKGRHTVQVIRGIMQQNLQDVHDQETINLRATETLKRFEQSVTDFARKFSEKLRPDYSMSDFAVDVVPVWNAERNDLDFSLLEVQYVYRHNGLTQVDPASAARVEAFRNSLQNDARKKRVKARITSLFRSLE